MAEAILAHLRPDWTVDSAGTGGWHAGSAPDARTTAELARHGIARAHRARQVTAEDFVRFDLILAMDRQNLRDLTAVRPAKATARLQLIDERDVPDPYYDGAEAFAAIYVQLERCCRALARDV